MTRRMGGIVIIALQLCAGAALAQTPDVQPRERLRAICAGEVQKYCATTERGKSQLRTCLASHEDNLSPGCKKALEDRKR
jgi:hypothetical protein